MVLFYLVVALLLASNVIKAKKSLHMLQLNLYNENNRYLKWLWKNTKVVVGIDWLIVFLSFFGAFVTFDLPRVNRILFLLMMGLAFAYSYYSYKRQAEEVVKKPFVLTSRVKRLLVTLSILYLFPVVMMIFFSGTDMRQLFTWLIVLSSLTAAHYAVVALANLINYPVERLVYHYFERKAKKKLASMPNLKVVGITGSYGKTSSKNILSDILNIKYIALPTPKSLNTNYGLMMTVNQHLDKFTEIFLAEMGAYKRGEIKSLCDLVHPKYGILTVIGTAHLMTFGSEENIVKGKFELIESLPVDGVGVLNKDDPKQVAYPLQNKCRLLWIGIEAEDVDVRASNLCCHSKGMSFDVKFRGDENVYPFETKLLGKHNVYNILDGLALGREFGIPIASLQQAVKRIRPIEHRLELKPMGSFYQIDNAYNSNPVGAKNALEVLAMMPGMKVVVTPGMVELGEKEYEYNKEFGKAIADVADWVILVGAKKTKPIQDGLRLKEYPEAQLSIVSDVMEAYRLLQAKKSKKEIYALFENDLIDTYNE